SKLALRNLTKNSWNVKLPDNTVRTVEPDGVMPLIKDFVVNIGSAEGTVFCAKSKTNQKNAGLHFEIRRFL
ncbi:MAG: hypothetical protein IIY35_02430, partial [Ruminococcus sp.]|nr:hypothetical protein [Ruminococcus sp.]